MKQVPKVLIEGPKALIEDAHSPPNLSTFGKTRSTLIISGKMFNGLAEGAQCSPKVPIITTR
jgi:hypothetical protein